MTAPDAGPPRLSGFFRKLFTGPLGAEACDELDRQYLAMRQRRGSALAWLWLFSHVFLADTWALAVAIRRRGFIRRDQIRGLCRTPMFTLTILLTFGFGIGANVAMLGIVDRIYFRPISLLRDPDTVHRVYFQRTSPQVGRLTSQATTYGQYLDLRRSTSSFADIAVFSERPSPVGTGHATRERYVSGVSASYYAFFDAPPALGRYFTAEDDHSSAAPVAVLSHAYWIEGYGGRDVLGDIVHVGGVRATIVGVAPRGFVGVDDANQPVVFVPVAALAGVMGLPNPAELLGYRFEWVNLLVRRAPGVGAPQAAADLQQAYVTSWENRRAQTRDGVAPADEAMPAAIAGPVRRAAGPAPLPEMRIAFWAAGLSLVVLLVSCANVASLLMTRALERRRELAVRAAMGAGRWRLASEAFVESGVLALGGAIVATFVASWAGSAIRRLLLPAEDTTISPFADWRIGLLTLVVALAAALITGAGPAWLAARRDPAGALGVRSIGGLGATRVRGALTIVQGTLSMALLIGAALFMRSVSALQAVPLGYDVDRVVVVNPIDRGTALDAAQQAELRRTLLAEVTRMPEVAQAGWAGAAPLWRSSFQPVFVPNVAPVASMGQLVLYAVDAGYFDVMGTGIIRGRGIASADRADAPPVAVVSAGMARAVWPESDPIGQCVHVAEATAPCTTVVGVAEDVLQSTQYLQDTPRFQYYLSIAQFPMDYTGFLLVRARGDTDRAAVAVRRALQPLMPGTMYMAVEPMTGLLARVQRPWRLGAILFLSFGALAMAVAAIGLYGLIRYNVAQRSRELAVRLALGAPRRHVARLVVGQATVLAGAGVVLGTALAAMAAPWLQPLLYRQPAVDVVSYAVVAALILVVTFGAALPGVRRAMQADPSTALRRVD